jgi:hypothetical protein
VTAGPRGKNDMNVFVRLLICAAIGVIAVVATMAIQGHYGSHSNAQLSGVAMVALVLAWTFTGMKRRS